jgi:hypothetical protein
VSVVDWHLLEVMPKHMLPCHVIGPRVGWILFIVFTTNDRVFSGGAQAPSAATRGWAAANNGLPPKARAQSPK